MHFTFTYGRLTQKRICREAIGFAPVHFHRSIAVHPLPLICLLCFFLYSHTSEATPMDSTSVILFEVDTNPIILNQNWKFHPGDDPSWAAPDFDDSDWSAIDPTTDIHYLTDLRAAEIGWFRLRLGVDTSLLNTPLAMTIFQQGASEIYLNGKLIHKLGVVSQDPNKEVIFNPNLTPYSFQFEDKPHQVLAVRFSFTKRNPYMNFLGLWGAIRH